MFQVFNALSSIPPGCLTEQIFWSLIFPLDSDKHSVIRQTNARIAHLKILDNNVSEHDISILEKVVNDITTGNLALAERDVEESILVQLVSQIVIEINSYGRVRPETVTFLLPLSEQQIVSIFHQVHTINAQFQQLTTIESGTPDSGYAQVPSSS